MREWTDGILWEGIKIRDDLPSLRAGIKGRGGRQGGEALSRTRNPSP
jgi:hypothetical protein